MQKEITQFIFKVETFFFQALVAVLQGHASVSSTAEPSEEAVTYGSSGMRCSKTTLMPEAHREVGCIACMSAASVLLPYSKRQNLLL